MSIFEHEFDRQVNTLIDRGYPEAAHLRADEFVASFAALRVVVSGFVDPELAGESNRVPFVLVVARGVVPWQFAMQRVQLGARTGVVAMAPKVPSDFLPTSRLAIPQGKSYLILAVETGTEYLNVTPAVALERIVDSGRSPLTLEEGIALVTLFPELLKKNACFSLSGSRAGDKRVPAIWISKGRAKLGWCWDGNPHTWLGSASCRARIGAN